MAAKKSDTATQGGVAASSGIGTSQRAEALKGDAVAAAAGIAQKETAKGKPRLVKTPKAREREVELAKSLVYGALPEIIQGIVEQAKGGNHNAAKFLLQFAGIKSLSAESKAGLQPKPAKSVVASAPEAANESPAQAVESFYRKLGMTPPVLLPPVVAAECEEIDEPWLVTVEGHAAPAGTGIGTESASSA